MGKILQGYGKLYIHLLGKKTNVVNTLRITIFKKLWPGKKIYLAKMFTARFFQCNEADR